MLLKTGRQEEVLTLHHYLYNQTSTLPNKQRQSIDQIQSTHCAFPFCACGPISLLNAI